MNLLRCCFMLVVIFSTTFSISQSSEKKSLLWKVYSSSTKDTSFIYGTIHIIEKKDMVLSKRLKNALKNADALLMEVDLNMDKETKRRVGEMALLPNHQTYKNYLNIEEANFLSAYMKDTLKLGGFKIMIYGMMKPFFLQAALLSEGIKHKASFELTFQKIASRKKQLGLETIDEQMELISGKDPLKDQFEQLIVTLKKGELSSNQMSQIVSLYKKQDVEALHTFTVSSIYEECNGNNQKSAEMLESILYNRNRNWIPKIETQITKEITFIAVGAAHLGGDKGVLNLLRKKGYFVEPVF